MPKNQEQLRVQCEWQEAERAWLVKLADLAKRGAQVWTSIPGLLARRTASGYDEGVALLAELRDLAVHQGQLATFDVKLAQVIGSYATSLALQRRLKEKRL